MTLAQVVPTGKPPEDVSGAGGEDDVVVTLVLAAADVSADNALVVGAGEVVFRSVISEIFNIDVVFRSSSTAVEVKVSGVLAGRMSEFSICLPETTTR